MSVIGGGFVIGQGFFKLLDYFGKFTYGAEGAQKASESFRKALKETFSGEMSLKELFTLTLEPFGDVFNKFIITPIQGFGGKMKDLFLNPLTTILGEAQTAYSATVNQIGASGGILTKCKGIVSGVGGAFKGLWKIMLANPVATIVVAIGTVVAALIHLWNTNEDFRNWVIDFYNDCIKPVVKGVVEAVKDMWNGGLKPLWDEIKPVLQSIWELINTLWDKTANLIGGILKFVSPIIAGVVAAIGEAIKTITSVINSLMGVLNGIIKFIKGVFTGNWKQAWEGVKQIFSNIWETMKKICKGAINIFISAINGFIKGLNKIHLPNWDILGSLAGKGINIPLIPKLAKGGIIDSPMVAMMGEYPGASGNPEIVTPQNLLTEIINKGNSDMVGALYQMCQQVITAINGLDMSVSIGDETIAQSAQRGNQAYKRRTGQPLFV